MSTQNLPVYTTTFVGRQSEVNEINALLADPTCRLLTLLGVGGVGKTRLAIAAAEAQGTNFTDGVYFIPLQALASAEGLLPAVVDALEIQLHGGASDQEQVVHFLQNRELLLVLDNFEHVLEGAELLDEIVRTAPKVTILVTSREALNLQSEWLYHVEGMPFPRDDVQIEAYGAVQLFAERARQVRRGFSLAEERRPVATICRLVEGMPLALELAATWLRAMSCEAVAAELERSLDFLVTELRDVPDRHRSMRAVFAQSWQLLREEEQAAFMKLSVFRGGFTREAAAAVAGTTLGMLSAFVDKSLLRLLPSGRYDIHELLRQYAEEKLAEVPSVRESALDQHCEYFMGLISENAKGSTPWTPSQNVLEAIYSENENIQQAWQYAIDYDRFERIQQALLPLGFYYAYIKREGGHLFLRMIDWLRTDHPQGEQGIALGFALSAYGCFFRFRNENEYERSIQLLHQEGIDLLRRLNARQVLVHALLWFSETLFTNCDFTRALEQAKEALSIAEAIHDDVGMGLALNCMAIIERMAGHYRETQRLMERSSELFQQSGFLSSYQRTRGYLAEVAQLRGEFSRAQQMMAKALPMALEVGRLWHIGQQYEYIGHIEHGLGNYALAEDNLLESLRIAHIHGDPRRITFSLVALGDLYCGMADVEQAQQVYQQAIDLSRSAAQRWQEAWALRGLGQVAYSTGDYRQAEQYAQDSLQRCHEIGWKYGTVQAHNVLGLVAVERDHGEVARHHFYQSLASDLVVETPPLILATVCGIVRLWSSDGRPDHAVELLGLVLSHPKSHADTRAVAQHLLDALQTELPADVFQTAFERGQNGDLENVVRGLSDELAEQVGQVPRAAAQALDEPLTKTELEILRLMASALSYPEIADHRNVSLNTIKTHRSSIYTKLGVSSRDEAVQNARVLALL